VLTISLLDHPLDDLTRLEAALSEVWRQLVHQVAGEDAVPEAITFDWQLFREKLALAVEETAQFRWTLWYGALKRRRGPYEHHEDLQPAQKKVIVSL
jgi:hypothetical protein